LRAEGGAEFGIPNVLSLLRINIGGTAEGRRSEDAGQQRESERYHTYGSLLYRVREMLAQRGIIKRFDGTAASWASFQTTDFVELRGTFRPNPFTESLKAIDRIAGIFETFAGLQAKLVPGNPIAGTSKQRQPNQANNEQRVQLEQVKAVRTLLKGLIDDVEKTDIRIVVADLREAADYRALAAVFTEYLRDPSMTELSRKEYRILGRVVGKMSNVGQSIKLLQGTGLGGLGDESIGTLRDALQFGALPKPETEIPAPAVQVLPIAIYVWRSRRAWARRRRGSMAKGAVCGAMGGHSSLNACIFRADSVYCC